MSLFLTRDISFVKGESEKRKMEFQRIRVDTFAVCGPIPMCLFCTVEEIKLKGLHLIFLEIYQN